VTVAHRVLRGTKVFIDKTQPFEQRDTVGTFVKSVPLGLVVTIILADQ
jgi:hypothetical protein